MECFFVYIEICKDVQSFKEHLGLDTIERESESKETDTKTRRKIFSFSSFKIGKHRTTSDVK